MYQNFFIYAIGDIFAFGVMVKKLYQSADDNVKRILEQCISNEPEMRPSAKKLVQELTQLIK